MKLTERMSTTLENHLEEVLKLKAYGFNIMPIPAPVPLNDGTEGWLYDGKTPYKKVSWRNFVTQPLSKAALTAHYTANQSDSIAILTGHASNLCVIDLDRHDAPNEEVQQAMNLILTLFNTPPPIAFTGGGGVHFYVQQAAVKTVIGIPLNQIFPDAPPSKITIDLKSDGGYIIAPPSLHRSGKQYLWHPSYPLDTDSFPLPQLPPGLKAPAGDRAKPRTPDDWHQLATSSPDGLRHNNATAMIGLFLLRFPPQYWESVVWPSVQDWNKRAVKPPLTDKDLRTTFESLARKEYEKYKV